MESLAPPLSCPTKAGHPVITESLMVTGSPAFAGDDDGAGQRSTKNHGTVLRAYFFTRCIA
jgi:hypothetical protein